MQPHLLDDGFHMGLGIAEAKLRSVDAQAPRQDREVEHQRRVAEHELAEIDVDIAACVDGSGKRPAAVPLCRPVLVASTAQYR
jgi:hypothetical protein